MSSNHNKKKYKDCVTYSILVLLGIAVRYVYFLCYPLLSRDSIFYLNQVQVLNERGWQALLCDPEYYTPPLFLRIVQVGTYININAGNWAIGVNIFLGALTCLIIYEITRHLFNDRSKAIITSLFVCCMPYLVKFSCQIQRESGFLFFISLGVLFGTFLYSTAKWRYLVGAVVAISIASLFRYEGILLLLFVLIPFHWHYKYRGLCFFVQIFATLLLFILTNFVISLCFSLPLNYWDFLLTNRIISSL